MRCENEKKKTRPSIELDSSLCFSSHQSLSCNILETEVQIGLKREAFWILFSTFHSFVCASQPMGWDVWLYLSLRQWSKEKLQLTGTSCYGRKHHHAARDWTNNLPRRFISATSLPGVRQRWRHIPSSSRRSEANWKRWVLWVHFGHLDRHDREMIGNPRKEQTCPSDMSVWLSALPHSTGDIFSWHHLLWSPPGERPGIFHV